MLGTYHLFLVNCVLFLLLLVSLLFVRLIYPKKEINPIIIVFLFSLLPVVSIFRAGTYQSGDFSLHIYETLSFFDSLKEGILIPRWGADLNATYGYPIHLFAYPLPRYIISLFALLGFTFITSLKLFLAFSYVASGITMYFFLKKNLNRFSSAVGSIFYLFAPYHLVDLHFRVAIGEVLSFVFIPLVFLFTQYLIEKATLLKFLILSLTVCLLILSHQAVSLSTTVLLFLFVIFMKGSFRSKIIFVFSFLYGLGLSAFYWIPVLFEKQYTLEGLFHQSVFLESLQTLLYSPWRYGLLFQGPYGELALIIGYSQILVLTMVLHFLFTNRINKKIKFLTIFFLISSFFVVFLITKYSLFLWNIFPIMKDFQFSYRLLTLVAFSTSIIAGILAYTSKNKLLLYTITLFAIASTILNWGNRTMILNLDDNWHRNNIPNSTAEGEGNGQSAPRWVNKNEIWESKRPKTNIEILRGYGQIKEIYRSSTKHEYIINAQSSLYVRENTVYFPGWTAYVNGNLKKINYEEKLKPGVIHLELPRGLHLLKLEFRKTLPRAIGEATSITFFLILAIGILRYLRRLPKI